jgi:hypothetical protein
MAEGSANGTLLALALKLRNKLHEFYKLKIDLTQRRLKLQR